MLITFILIVISIWTVINLLALLPSYTYYTCRYILIVEGALMLTIFGTEFSMFNANTFPAVLMTWLLSSAGIFALMMLIYVINDALDSFGAFNDSKFFCIYRLIRKLYVKENKDDYSNGYLDLPEEFPDGVYDESETNFRKLIEKLIEQ